MRLLLAIGLGAIVALSPAVALADDEPPVTPVKEGAAAPFTGLLVPELRLTELLKAEVERDKLKVEVQLRIKYAESVEEMYSKKLLEATAPTPWYEQPSFNRWIGFTIGIVVTGLVVWGGVEIVKATGGHGA